MKKHVTLITDGACSGNPGPGGWAALLRYKSKEKLLAGGEPETTNNRMEIMAVIRGLQALKEPAKVTIVSDSKYVIDTFEKGWFDNWVANNWRTSANKPVKNVELWQELYEAMSDHDIIWEWVKGHNGHVDNERVDKAARDEARKFMREITL